MSSESSFGRPAAPAAQATGPDNRWLVLMIVSLAKFMVGLDATIVNVALPSIERSLHMSQSNLQWVVNAYALVFGGFLLLAGRLADRFGRKELFLAGTLLFVLASAANGFATSAWVLVVGRGLQGLGGALLSPAALSILTTSFKDSAERTKALSLWAALVAGGSATGLLVGGVLTSELSWRWIFYFNLPLGAAVLAAGGRSITRSVRRAAAGFDVMGAITVTAGMVMLVYVVVNGQKWGWASVPTLAFAAGAIALLAGFVVVERRSRSPLMQLTILRIRSVAVADLVLVFSTSGIFAMFFFTSLYLQGPLGYSPLLAGLAFLPAAIGVMGASAMSQRFIKRFGLTATGFSGLVLTALGMVVMARLPVHGSYVLDLLPGLLAISIGLGVSFVPLTFLATAGVPEADAGLASGLWQMVQQVGGPLGLAVLSTLAVWRTTVVLHSSARGLTARTAAEVAGFRTAFAGAALLLAIGAILFITLLRRRPAPSASAQEEKTTTSGAAAQREG
jgi:EmrB/QacA subfamily drug resistance transporter